MKLNGSEQRRDVTGRSEICGGQEVTTSARAPAEVRLSLGRCVTGVATGRVVAAHQEHLIGTSGTCGRDGQRAAPYTGSATNGVAGGHRAVTLLGSSSAMQRMFPTLYLRVLMN